MTLGLSYEDRKRLFDIELENAYVIDLQAYLPEVLRKTRLEYKQKFDLTLHLGRLDEPFERMFSLESKHLTCLFEADFDTKYTNSVDEIINLFDEGVYSIRTHLAISSFVSAELRRTLLARGGIGRARRTRLYDLACRILAFDLSCLSAAYSLRSMSHEKRRREALEASIQSFNATVTSVVQTLHDASALFEVSSKEVKSALELSSDRSALTSTSVDEIVSSAAETLEVMGALSHIGLTVSEAAERGQHHSQVAKAAILDSDQSLQQLSGTIDQIGDLVQSIARIANQTNLLALNAAIEAARAGEAGRGFSVVAGEVKSLAGETSKATDAIRNWIAKTQAQKLELVAFSANAAEVIDDVIRATSSITEMIPKQRSAAKDMYRKFRLSAERSQDVAIAVKDVQSAIEAVASGTGKLLLESANLSGTASDLSRRVEVFFDGVREV